MGLPAFQPPSDAPARVSPADYLRLEREAEYKHEYFDGEIRAMAGAEPVHNEINYNFNQVLGPHLRRRGCKGYMGDQRVQTKSQAGYLYPDTVVACGPEFSDKGRPQSLLNPVFIAEVLSASTQDKDRGEKFMLYRQIPSLRHYLLLSSQAVHAELYSLDERGRWVLTETRELSAVLDLEALDCQLPLATVYEGVALVSSEPELPLA
ncbi:hypothetical protein A0257_14755 [Hymenobacter psoromatis]|nr:hypothetical protein A0257_14755 [Hymenobacter psoromatis]